MSIRIVLATTFMHPSASAAILLGLPDERRLSQSAVFRNLCLQSRNLFPIRPAQPRTTVRGAPCSNRTHGQAPASCQPMCLDECHDGSHAVVLAGRARYSDAGRVLTA